MDFLLFIPALSGLLYAVASLSTKKSLAAGGGLLRAAFVANWIFVPVFFLPLTFRNTSADWSAVGWPLLAGSCFFLGQVLTYAAIRAGDVSLQTPLMGSKVLFVAILATVFGAQAIDLRLGLAAGATTLAVALLGISRSIRGARVGLTVLLALASSVAFAASDVLVGTHGGSFGPSPFLAVTVLVNALLSLSLLPFFREPLRRVPPEAWKWMIGGGFLMAVQALLLNTFLAETGRVAEANILYSTRGFWSVILGTLLAGVLGLPNEKLTRPVLLSRLAGAVLMSAGIWLVVG